MVEEKNQGWSSDAPLTAQPSARDNRGFKIGVLCAGLGLLFFVLCGVSGLFLANLGLDAIGNDLQAELQENRVVQEQVGPIESLTYHWGASMDSYYDHAFAISGELGQGVLHVDTLEVDGIHSILEGMLVMESGEEFDLFPFSWIEAQLQEELESNSVLLETIGDIETFVVNWERSLEYESDDEFVYEVVGSLGSGEIWVRSFTNEEGLEEIDAARLFPLNGEAIDLVTAPKGDEEGQ